jgi:hypothetical protein
MYKKIEIDQTSLSKVVNGKDSQEECIPQLVAYNGSLQIAHWRANTVTNEHKTLGDLYEQMVGFADEFAEVYMGKYGVVGFPSDAVIRDLGKKPITEGLNIVNSAQKYFDAGKDDDLLNILADIKIALNKAKYLLKE